MAKVKVNKTGRREFLVRAWAIALGAVTGLVPVLAGLFVFLDPLRRNSQGNGTLVRVAPLLAVPTSGKPRKFAVVGDRVDAWNKYPQVPIGAVYLRRTGENTVEAFNAICPHAGGFIDYMPQRNCFVCPLHNSEFALNGAVNDPKSPSARGMDSLPVEIRDGEVWVRFQNFRAGIRKKIAA